MASKAGYPLRVLIAIIVIAAAYVFLRYFPIPENFFQVLIFIGVLFALMGVIFYFRIKDIGYGMFFGILVVVIFLIVSIILNLFFDINLHELN